MMKIQLSAISFFKHFRSCFVDFAFDNSFETVIYFKPCAVKRPVGEGGVEGKSYLERRSQDNH